MLNSILDENHLDKINNYSEIFNGNIDECLDSMKVWGNYNIFKLGNVIYFYNFSIEDFCKYTIGEKEIIILGKEELTRRINIHLRKDKLEKICSKLVTK